MKKDTLAILGTWFAAIMFSALLAATITLTGCSKDEGPDAVSGGSSKKVSLPSLPAFPDFPNLPGSPVGGLSTTPAATTDAVGTGTQPAATPAGKVEVCEYAGRFNGNRPTWYCGKDMADYPASFLVDISGCFTRTVKNNGHRYEDSQLIAKQSDVSGRGLALVAVASCTSTTASVRYLL